MNAYAVKTSKIDHIYFYILVPKRAGYVPPWDRSPRGHDPPAGLSRPKDLLVCPALSMGDFESSKKGQAEKSY